MVKQYKNLKMCGTIYPKFLGIVYTVEEKVYF